MELAAGFQYPSDSGLQRRHFLHSFGVTKPSLMGGEWMGRWLSLLDMVLVSGGFGPMEVGGPGSGCPTGNVGEGGALSKRWDIGMPQGSGRTQGLWEMAENQERPGLAEIVS